MGHLKHRPVSLGTVRCTESLRRKAPGVWGPHTLGHPYSDLWNGETEPPGTRKFLAMCAHST